MAFEKDAWCVLAAIKFTEQFDPCVMLIIHQDEAYVRALAEVLSADDYWPTTTRLIKYDQNIRELKEGDILCGYKITLIFNHVEIDLNSDVVRKVIEEARRPDGFPRGN